MFELEAKIEWNYFAQIIYCAHYIMSVKCTNAQITDFIEL